MQKYGEILCSFGIYEVISCTPVLNYSSVRFKLPHCYT